MTEVVGLEVVKKIKNMQAQSEKIHGRPLDVFSVIRLIDEKLSKQETNFVEGVIEGWPAHDLRQARSYLNSLIPQSRSTQKKKKKVNK